MSVGVNEQGWMIIWTRNEPDIVNIQKVWKTMPWEPSKAVGCLVTMRDLHKSRNYKMKLIFANRNYRMTLVLTFT